ncbi:MAG: hypothetical protein AB1327_04020, partial [Bacillota bacterium]
MPFPGRADDGLQVPAAQRPPGSRLILAEPAAGTAGSPARRAVAITSRTECPCSAGGLHALPESFRTSLTSLKMAASESEILLPISFNE